MFLSRSSRSVRDLQRAVLPDLGTSQVSLEQRAHLRISRAAVLQDGEVEDEGEDVDGKRDNDQTDDSSNKVGCKFDLQKLDSFGYGVGNCLP